MIKLRILFFFVFCCYTVSAQTGVADSLKAFKTLDSTFTLVYQNDLVTGIKIAERMDSLASYVNSDTLRVKVTNNKAMISRSLGFTDIAMEDLFSSLKMAEASQYGRMVAKINYDIGVIYQNSLGDYTNATKHLRAAYEVAVASKLYVDTTYYNYSIAENLIFLGKIDEGVQLMKDNVAEAKKTDRYVMILGGLETLAFVYHKLGKTQQSMDRLYEILPYLDKINSNYHSMVAYLHIAQLSIAMGKWDSASKYMNMAIPYSLLVNSAEWYEDCYGLQSKIYAHEGKYKDALDAKNLSVKFKDSVYRKDYQNKIAALSTRYGLEKKQAEISILQKDNALRAVKVRQRELQRNIVILVGVLVIVIVIAFFRGWMNRRTKKLQMTFSRTLLKNQEDDKQRIAQELHDSIGQNVLFIKNQISAQPDDGKKAKVLEAITSTLADIRDISKDLYPNQLDKYGLAAAVNALADKTMSLTDIFMSASLEEIDAMLSKEAKINCYRIVQECVTNTLKHAKAKAIRVTGEIQKGKVVLSIADNGKGFDTSLMANKAQSSFGLLGIEERARILGGKIDIDTSSKGTRIIIIFPIINHAA